MNCIECKRLLVEYTEDLSEVPQKMNILDHLEQCPGCRDEAEAIRRLQLRLVNDARAIEQAPLEDKVMNQIFREQNSRRTAKTAFSMTDIGGLVMKRSLLRIAAVAVVIVGILIGLNSLQNKVTYAKVIDPVLNAGTIIYDVGEATDGFSFHDIVIGRKIRRTIPSMKIEMILDVDDNSRILGLDPIHKRASFLNVGQEGRELFDWQRDLLYLIRSVVRDAVKAPQSAVNKLGRQTVNGLDAVGFEFNPGKDNTEIIIWADPATAVPLQIEIHAGKDYSLSGKVFTLRNIEFDKPVDESLVNMELPAGYVVKEWQMFCLELYEDDFFKVLQMWAQYSPDGTFPDVLKHVDPLQLASLRKSSGQPDLSPEEREETWGLYMRGISFLGALGNNDVNYRYSGEGVRYGTANKAIFRYRLPDSSSWRVLYADLHVETVPAENPAR